MQEIGIGSRAKGLTVEASEVEGIVRWANEARTPLVPVSSGAPNMRGDSTPSVSEAFVVGLSVMKRIRKVDRRNRLAGLGLMSANEFANGSVIYTQSGYYAREFGKRTHGGMVGVNVGIPVPLGIFGFTGHKNSFFGNLHAMGTDGVRFFTGLKSITTHWFSQEDAMVRKVLNSWRDDS